MDKKDARLFTDFCQFIFYIGDALPLIFDTDNEIYNSKGIDFNALKVEFKTEKNNNLKTGKIILTKAGEELYSICEARKNERFYKYVINQLQQQGCIVNAITIQAN